MDERIAWPARAADWVAQNSTELLIGSGAALVAVAVMLLLRQAGSRITAADPSCRTWKSVIGRVLAKTSLAFVVIVALDVLVNFTAPPREIARPVDIAFIIAAALQAAIWGRELIMGILSHQAGDEMGETALDNARAVIRVLVSVALFAIAAVVILDNLGANVTALIAGLGIGGIAIGLAAQGIFADLFAALSILFDKPFRRGEVISYGTSVGTVEKIGLKTTRIRSLSGEHLVMANTKLLEQEIRNLALGATRRTTLTFGVVYHTGPDKLDRLREIGKEAVKTHKGCGFVRCAMTGFGPSSLDHELVFDTASVDPNVIAANRTAVMMSVIRAFAAEGIEFAYPTQTTYTAAPDGTLVMPYATPPARA